MSNHNNISWKLVGRGSEASVYFDEEEFRVVKKFDRSSIEDARVKAERELTNLRDAQERTRRHDRISVPNPMGLSQSGDSIYMEFVPGSSLLWHLMHMQYTDIELKEWADLVSEGLSILNSSEKMLQPDCTLDHIFVGEPNKITFLDFGNGSEQLDGIVHYTTESLYAELIGSTVYECSRASRSVSRKCLTQVGRFLGLLVDRSSIDFSDELRSRTWERADYRMSGGSFARTLYYQVKGKWVFKRIWAAATGSQNLAEDIKNDNARKSESCKLENVFFVVSDFPEDLATLSNGIHKAVHGLAEGMSSATDAPALKVLAIGKRGAVDTRYGYTVEFFPSFWALAAFVRNQSGKSISVLNSIFSVKNNVLALFFNMFRQPYVVAPHLELSERLFAKNRITKWVYWNLIEKWSLRMAVGVHLLDERQRDRLRFLGVPTPSFSSPNGVLDSILDATPEMTWSDTGPVQFHFFGRIEARTKGLDMLLTAVSRISADHSIEVFIQGPDCGDLQSLEAEVVKMRLESVVHFVPPDYSSNPIDIMSQYDVFILPSRFEGFPVAAVEAMVAARPIVMTDVGGLAPVIRANELGIVVEPTKESIEAGMRRAIASRPDWKKQGLKAREYAISHFRWGAIGQDVLRHLEELTAHE
ncbi:glycosyltransferase [bacterium]|nr:glycosyltransferase [bacterium]